MTCIVGYIDKGKVWMGADSAGSSGVMSYKNKTEKIVTRNNILFGNTGTYKQVNLLRYVLKIPKHPSKMSTTRYVNTLLVEAIRECFKTAGHSQVKDNKENYGGAIIVGYRGKLIEITPGYHVFESYYPFMVAGCGKEVASGALYALEKYKNITPRQRIMTALKASTELCSHIKPPFHIRSL